MLMKKDLTPAEKELKMGECEDFKKHLESERKAKPNYDKEIKMVNWYHDWGVLVPHCPSCDELAYGKERCVFCGQPYLMTPKPIPKLEVYGDTLYAVMPSKTSIYVFEQVTGALVCHQSVEGEWDKEKLKKHLEKIEKGL